MEKIIDRPGAPPGPDDEGWVSEVSAYLATPDTPGIVDDIDPAPTERVPQIPARRLGDGAIRGVGVSGSVNRGTYSGHAYRMDDLGRIERGLDKSPNTATPWRQPGRYSAIPGVLGWGALGPQTGSRWAAMNREWHGWQEPGRY